MYEPEAYPEFDAWEEFGTLQVRADMFGLHIGGNEQAEIWIDGEETEQLIRFAQYWLPRIQAAKIPKCPACYAKHDHTPGEDQHDGEMKPVQGGTATEWNCSCGKSYNSGPFGHDLREINPQISQYPSDGDEFDPFLELDDL